jgi:hypothetical protein
MWCTSNLKDRKTHRYDLGYVVVTSSRVCYVLQILLGY